MFNIYREKNIKKHRLKRLTFKHSIWEMETFGDTWKEQWKLLSV